MNTEVHKIQIWLRIWCLIMTMQSWGTVYSKYKNNLITFVVYLYHIQNVGFIAYYITHTITYFRHVAWYMSICISGLFFYQPFIVNQSVCWVTDRLVVQADTVHLWLIVVDTLTSDKISSLFLFFSRNETDMGCYIFCTSINGFTIPHNIIALELIIIHLQNLPDHDEAKIERNEPSSYSNWN